MSYSEILVINDGKYTLSMLILLYNKSELNLTEIRNALGVKNAQGVARSKELLKELGLIKEETKIVNENRVSLTDTQYTTYFLSFFANHHSK
jgi:predicted transcriptional regulator